MVFTKLFNPISILITASALTSCSKIEIEQFIKERSEIMTANQIAWQNMLENKRSNVSKETETKRHNVTTEVETGRHNKSTESLGFSNLSELGRHNLQMEAVNWYNAQELNRANQANEAIKWSGLGIQQQQADTQAAAQKSQAEHWTESRKETKRSNLEQESISRFQNTLRSSELLTKIEQFNRAQTETERHNRMNEIMDAIDQIGGLYRDIVGTNLNAGARVFGITKGGMN